MRNYVPFENQEKSRKKPKKGMFYLSDCCAKNYEILIPIFELNFHPKPEILYVVDQF